MSKERIHTRTHSTGRIPSLRDKIVDYLKGQEEPRTVLEIATALGVDKSTPYRPLKILTKMKLIDETYDIDGAQYKLDKEFLEYFKMDPRRVR